MATRPLMRVAFINCVSPLGRAYASACRALPAAELVGLIDDDPDAAQVYAESMGIPVYESVRELMRDASPAAIVIAGPTLHAIASGILSRHRVHLLHAWPWGSTVRQTRNLKDSAIRVDRVLSYAFPYRGLFEALNAHIGDGPLGTLRRVSLRVGGAGADIGNESLLSSWGGLADPVALVDGAWGLLGLREARFVSARISNGQGEAVVDSDAARLGIEWLRVPDEPQSTLELHCDRGLARIWPAAWWAGEPSVTTELHIRGREEAVQVALPPVRSGVKATLDAFLGRCNVGFHDPIAVAQALAVQWLISALAWSADHNGRQAQLRRGRRPRGPADHPRQGR